MTGAELRAIRDRMQLTQQALAEKLGVHEVTVAHWESGKRPILKLSELAINYVCNSSAVSDKLNGGT